jgi:beta-glucosidase
VKHFVANESETDRMTMDAVVDERTLRELYLLPFEIAVREGGALGVMTAYNRLNGVHCAEHTWLLRDVLRGEWGFEGFVVSDWGTCGTASGAAQAGLDLEMPGPGRFYGSALADAVVQGEVTEEALDRAVRHVLRLAGRPAADPAPVDAAEHARVAREAAAAGMVLLKNDGDLLPLAGQALGTLAVVGPFAARAATMGGGSAHLPSHRDASPLQALREALPHVTVSHASGVEPPGPAPLVELSAGLVLEEFDGHLLAGEPVRHSRRRTTDLTFFEPGAGAFSARATGTFVPARSGRHSFTLAQLGRGRLLLDGAVVVDGWADPPAPGTAFLGLGSEEAQGEADLEAGRPVELVIEHANVGASALSGVRVGLRPPHVDGVAHAVQVAAAADAVVLVVGTGDAWESEGFDRRSLSLPGGQDDLVEAVLAANPRTVVVLNTGSVVTMPWAERAPAVLQAWFGGQEMDRALADVLLGDAEPGGRLPTTVPVREEHGPAYRNETAQNGTLRYGEGLLMGYRWFDTRELPTRFPFGHGLSYTSFEIGPPLLSRETFAPGTTVSVDVAVTNTGSRPGSEVVQLYVAPPPCRLARPARELKAFAKVHLRPGESATVRLPLDDRAFAYWDDGDPGTDAPLPPWVPTRPPGENRGWTVEPGTYQLHVGRSLGDIHHVVPLRVIAGR